MAEKYHGWKAPGLVGIGVDRNNILVDLCFKEESKLLDFQSGVRDLFRKKRQLDEDEFKTYIADEKVSRIDITASLVRIMAENYEHPDGIDDPNNSPYCDLQSNSLSIFSGEVANINEAEIRVQMIEQHNSRALFGQSPEKAHIKDKAHCIGKEEADDINNLIFMGRLIHQHFDGIETTPINTPSFLIRYIAHDDAYVDCPIIGENAHIINPLKKRQRVVVHIVYRDAAYAESLSQWLRDGATKLSNRVYQLELFFEDAARTKEYLQWKENRTLYKWVDNDIENIAV
jgi:hypothetical protein